jgi:hypothetical protein
METRGREKEGTTATTPAADTGNTNIADTKKGVNTQTALKIILQLKNKTLHSLI